MTATNTTVGETRAWLEAAYGVPHALSTHYVIVADAPDGLRVIGCCDGTAEAGDLLRQALDGLTGEVAPLPSSESVIVSRDDLAAVLAESEGFIGGKDNPAFSRLAAAAGVQ